MFKPAYKCIQKKNPDLQVQKHFTWTEARQPKYSNAVRKLTALLQDIQQKQQKMERGTITVKTIKTEYWGESAVQSKSTSYLEPNTTDPVTTWTGDFFFRSRCCIHPKISLESDSVPQDFSGVRFCAPRFLWVRFCTPRFLQHQILCPEISPASNSVPWDFSRVKFCIECTKALQMRPLTEVPCVYTHAQRSHCTHINPGVQVPLQWIMETN